MIIKEIFGNKKIIGLAGNKSEGKTNNLMALVKDFRKKNKITPIYVYGLNEICLNWLEKFGNIYEFSSMDQLIDKENSLIIIEEFQRLKLNDRRYRDILNEFIDFIYHNNNWVIFSSPNLREYNSVIGGKIERWILKSLSSRDLINGCQLKEEVLNYNGRFKILKNIRIDKNKILVINKDYEKVLKFEYIEDVDDKKENIDIFSSKDIKKLSEKLSSKMSKRSI